MNPSPQPRSFSFSKNFILEQLRDISQTQLLCGSFLQFAAVLAPRASPMSIEILYEGTGEDGSLDPKAEYAVLRSACILDCSDLALALLRYMA